MISGEIHYSRLVLPILQHPRKRSRPTQSPATSKSWTPSFHPSRSDQCVGKKKIKKKYYKWKCCPTYSTSAVPGNGQREVIYGCNKCPQRHRQKKMLFSSEKCWTQSYSNDGQNGEESVQYAPSFILSASVRWQWINIIIYIKTSVFYFKCLTLTRAHKINMNLAVTEVRRGNKG